MALSKLNPLCFFFTGTPLSPQNTPSSQLFLPPSKIPFPLQQKTQTWNPLVLLPYFPTKEVKEERKNPLNSHYDHGNSDPLSVAFPSLAFSNTLFFNSAYNVQVIVGENEPEERLISRFRREVLKAGVIQEAKRRRFFETTQEKTKRKRREAAKRNRKKRPQPRVSRQDKTEAPKKKDASEDDNWEYLDVELPYC